jgi:Tol biopolymer transport system component
MQEKMAAAPTPIKADGQALTSVGENFDATFAPDGQRIVFVSTNRKQHKQGQIYELDLKTHKEKRITYQGSVVVHSPQYSPKGDAILYASGTDELKEISPLLYDKKADADFTGPADYLERTELYLHHLPGLQMERLSNHPGYDGEARFLNHNELIFTRRDKGNLGVFEKSIKSNSAHPLKGAGPRSAEASAALEGKRVAWIEFSPDFKTSSLKIKDGHNVESILDDVKALKKNPVWSPDGEFVLFSMNHPDAKAFEIYAVKKDGRCLTALTEEGGISEQPEVSPTQDAFLFTSNQSGIRQIYIKSFPKTLNCPPAPELIEKTP